MSPFSIYPTEIGAFAISGALADGLLFALSCDHGDSKGTLNFFVSHSSAPVHEQAPPPTIDFTVSPPVLLQHSVPPLRPTHSSNYRHDSVSSACEHLPLEVAAGYEADLDNPDRETYRATTRPSQPTPPSLSTTTNAPSSPHRRPSGPPAPRPSSPLFQSPAKPSNPPLPQAAERLRYQRNDATFVDKYGHVLPMPPLPPPLSPHHSSFSTNDDSTLSPPASRLRVRSGSDAGADREQALKVSEEKLEKQWQHIREPAPIGRPRAEASKETLSQTQESRFRKPYHNDAGDVMGRSDSWVVVPAGGRSTSQEQTQSSQELPRHHLLFQRPPANILHAMTGPVLHTPLASLLYQTPNYLQGFYFIFARAQQVRFIKKRVHSSLIISGWYLPFIASALSWLRCRLPIVKAISFKL